MIVPNERSRHEPYRRERSPVHDRLGKRVLVHDRLGGRTMLRDPAGRRVPVHDRLEQVADDRVQDDQPMRRDPEREPDRTNQPQWCPEGLTRSQKRCVYRLRQLEIIEEEQELTLSKKGVKSQVWHAKPRADEDQDSESSAMPINMVFIMPKEFMVPCNESHEPELEEAMAQLSLEPLPATFEKPKDEKRQHLKALFLKGFVDGKPVTKMLVDGGAAMNIMPYVMLRKLGKSQDDLTKTDMMLKDFEGVVSPALGALCVNLTIGSKTLSSTFFVINGKVSYSLLLGRVWIHANCCHLLCINV